MRDGQRTTSEDRATQLLISEALSLAMININCEVQIQQKLVPLQEIEICPPLLSPLPIAPPIAIEQFHFIVCYCLFCLSGSFLK